LTSKIAFAILSGRRRRKGGIAMSKKIVKFKDTDETIHQASRRIQKMGYRPCSLAEVERFWNTSREKADKYAAIVCLDPNCLFMGMAACTYPDRGGSSPGAVYCEFSDSFDEDHGILVDQPPSRSKKK